MIVRVFMKKHFIQADQLLRDSYNLDWKIFESGFKPDYIIGVWRGGAPVGIAVQEFLDFLGIPSDHIAIRTSYYSGINSRKDDVQVYGLNYVIRKLQSEDSLLIVDDVYETGIKEFDDRKKAIESTQAEDDLEILRIFRNNLLVETDYMGNSDVTMPTKWKTYRQELRDITKKFKSMNDKDFKFPEKPKE